MGCGRGITWDVKQGHLIALDRKHFPNPYVLAIHVNKRANQGYSDAVTAMLECTEDALLQAIVERSRQGLGWVDIAQWVRK